MRWNIKWIDMSVYRISKSYENAKQVAKLS